MSTAKAPAWIVPTTILVMITLLSFAAVEGFYGYLGSRLLPQDPGRATRSQPMEPAAPPRQSPPPSPPSAEMAPTGPDDQATPPLPTTSSIVRRNLFASRVGDAGSLPQQDLLAALEASSQEVVLMGTITGPQDEQRAIIYDKRSGRQELYAEGDYLEQAVIKQILRGKVILSVGGRDELLDITEARTVNVPQVSVPLPVTTSEQVTGRPVGAEPVEEQQPPPADAGSRIIVPQTDNPQVLRTIRK